MYPEYHPCTGILTLGQFHHTTNIILPKVIPDTTIHRITIVFRYHIQPIHSLHPKRGSRQGKLKIHPRHRSVPVIIQPLVIDITEVHPQLPHILHPEMLGGNYVIAVPVSVTHRRRTRKTIIVLIGVAQHIVGGRIVRPHHNLRCPLLPPSFLPYTQLMNS